MEATVAGRGSGATRGRGRGAAARPAAVPAAEMRRVLGDVLEAIEDDDTSSTLIRAAAPRLRLEVTDAALVLNLAPSDEPGGALRWNFDDKVDWEPRLRIWMD